MRLGLLAGMGRDWRDTIDKIRAAESMGYEVVATGEAWGPSTLPWMTLLATHTEKIQIGTSILNCYSRSPAAIAQEFAALEELSRGRMICGLGSSGHRVIEHFHGIEFKKPLRRLREYTEIIKLLLRGEELNYSGELYQMSRGFRLQYNIQRDNVPVYIAAITPKSIQQTGEIADGIYPIHWASNRFKSLKSDLNKAAQDASRTDSNITIAPFTNVYIGDEDDVNIWDAARQPLFHYVNRMGDFYWQMLAANGFEEDVANSRTAWSKRDREGALAAISTQMVREIQVIGPRDSIHDQLQKRSDDGADVQLIPMPTGSHAEVIERLELYIGG